MNPTPEFVPREGPMLLHLHALLLLIPSLPTVTAPAQATDDPPVLRVEGGTVARSTFDAALLETRATDTFESFIRFLLIDREARRLGFWPGAEEIDARVEETIRIRVDQAFGGDREAWRDEIEMLGGSESGYRRRRALEVGHELAQQALVSDARQATRNELVMLWEREFGPDGRALIVTQITLPVSVPPVVGRTSVERRREIADKVRKRAMDRARALREEYSTSEDLNALALRDGVSILTDVRLDGFSLGAAITEAVTAQAPGTFGEPHFRLGAVHCFRVDRVEHNPFDSVQERLRQTWLSRPASRSEGQQLFARLAATTEIDSRLHARRSEWRYKKFNMDRPIVILGEDEIPLSTYAAHLRHIFAYRALPGFVQTLAVELEAERLGVEPDEAAIDARVTELLELRVARMFQGNHARFESELRRKGKDLQTFRREQRRPARQNLRLQGILTARREDVPEDVTRGLWHERFGVDGLLYDVRLIRLQYRLPTAGSLDMKQYQAAENERLSGLAGAILKRLEAGEGFAELARRSSDDRASSKTGGKLEGGLHPDQWPRAIVAALEDLEPGDITEALGLGRDLVILQLLAERRTPFDEVRVKLEREVRERPASSVELAATASEVARALDWERLPAFGR